MMDPATASAEEEVYFEHSTVVALGSHRRENCRWKFCTIHNRSNHSMRTFPQSWDSINNVVVRVCPDGIGHLDPDQMQGECIFIACDGCCKGSVL